MDDEDDLMGPLRDQALAAIGDNALTLGARPATDAYGRALTGGQIKVH